MIIDVLGTIDRQWISKTMINVLIDRSGSMAENGKPMLMLNLVRFIRQSLDIKNVEFFVLQDQMTQVYVEPEFDIELPEIRGSIDMEPCIEFLIKRNKEQTILLSDGFFELTQTQKRLFKQQNVIIVAVGADADITGLDQLGLAVYLAQDIGVAIKYARNILNEQQIFPPRLCADVQFKQSLLDNTYQQDEDEDDEWH